MLQKRSDLSERDLLSEYVNLHRGDDVIDQNALAYFYKNSMYNVQSLPPLPIQELPDTPQNRLYRIRTTRIDPKFTNLQKIKISKALELIPVPALRLLSRISFNKVRFKAGKDECISAGSASLSVVDTTFDDSIGINPNIVDKAFLYITVFHEIIGHLVTSRF